MTSQIKYNTETSYSLLKVFIGLMEGDELTYDYYHEVTGLSKTLYKEFLHNFKEMLLDLKLGRSLQMRKTKAENEKTVYYDCYYSLSPRKVDDYRFELPYDVDDNKKILYLPIITYLLLKNKHYVAYDTLANFFPRFTNKTFHYLIEGLKNIIGEELYKDEFQCYVAEEDIE
ncbi:MAG: hypothetical protein IJP63_08160 [Acholeplasmatales bacterium]|nr:hypothetical protein [Acholeplasmatales bacterium]